MGKKVSDIVAEYIASKQIDHVFMVTGGGIMHLTDSIGTHKDLKYTCNHHEQACVIAAEGYARISNKPGIALVTIGPGAGNAIAGVFGAWYDSIPMIIISGQVRSDQIADYSVMRQRGVQEGNIIDTVKPITKYAVSIRNAKDIYYELNKAYTIATSGRPGPVWIEIPNNIQGEIVEYNNQTEEFAYEKSNSDVLKEHVIEAYRLISQSKRPLFIPGNGINLAGAREQWFELFDNINIPAAVSYTSKDLLVEDHDRSMGVFGTSGQRRANFAIQNSDCVIIIGAGLNVGKVGFNFKNFAPSSKKIIVDIDQSQIDNQPVTADIGVLGDAGQFMSLLYEQYTYAPFKVEQKWLDGCSYWKNKYPVIVNEYFDDKEHVNMYVFMDKISDNLKGGEIIVSGNGFDCVSLYQAFKVKPNQRVLINGNWGSMGWDLPLCVGAYRVKSDANIICITGDGSFQFNIQELLTIAYYKIPIKIFIYNNNGYASIRSTQNSLMDGRIIASDPKSGIGGPDYKKLAEAYGMSFATIDTNDELSKLEEILNTDGPVICELKIAYDVVITPKASAFKRDDGTLESRPLEDMFPFLPREEIAYNMGLFND